MAVWQTIHLADGSAHVFDPDLAAAWLDVVLSLSTDAQFSSADRSTPGAQIALINNVQQALSYAYQAANFPPTSDAVGFVPGMRDAYGPNINYDVGAAYAHPQQGWIAQRSTAAISAATRRPFADVQFVFPMRAYLDSRARMGRICETYASCVDASSGSTVAWDGHTGVGGVCPTMEDWRCISWQIQSAGRQIPMILPALTWSLEVMRRIASMLRQRGVERAIRDSEATGERLPLQLASNPAALNVPDPPGWVRPQPPAQAPTPPLVTQAGARSPGSYVDPFARLSPPAPQPSLSPAPAAPPSPAPSDQNPAPAPAPADSGSPVIPPRPAPSTDLSPQQMLAFSRNTCATWLSLVDSAKLDVVAKYIRSRQGRVPDAAESLEFSRATDVSCGVSSSGPTGAPPISTQPPAEASAAVTPGPVLAIGTLVGITWYFVKDKGKVDGLPGT